MFRKERGFTLIELLIVIAVVGIMAAAILPKFIAFDTQAKCASTQGSLSSLRTAIVNYRVKEGYFPFKMSGLAPIYITRIPFAQLPSVSAATGTTLTLPTGFTGTGWCMDRTLGEIWLHSEDSTDCDGDGSIQTEEFYTNW